MINIDALYLENLCGKALESGISTISNTFPEIRHLLCPIINAAYERQNTEAIELLSSRCTSDDGLWNCFLFVDGRTKDFHVENDCAYTFISIPRQFIDTKQHCTHQPTFMFKINNEQVISLQMTNDLSFFIMLPS